MAIAVASFFVGPLRLACGVHKKHTPAGRGVWGCQQELLAFVATFVTIVFLQVTAVLFDVLLVLTQILSVFLKFCLVLSELLFVLLDLLLAGVILAVCGQLVFVLLHGRFVCFYFLRVLLDVFLVSGNIFLVFVLVTGAGLSKGE